jgi:hypothetical protein
VTLPIHGTSISFFSTFMACSFGSIHLGDETGQGGQDLLFPPKSCSLTQSLFKFRPFCVSEVSSTINHVRKAPKGSRRRPPALATKSVRTDTRSGLVRILIFRHGRIERTAAGTEPRWPRSENDLQ